MTRDVQLLVVPDGVDQLLPVDDVRHAYEVVGVLVARGIDGHRSGGLEEPLFPDRGIAREVVLDLPDVDVRPTAAEAEPLVLGVVDVHRCLVDFDSEVLPVPPVAVDRVGQEGPHGQLEERYPLVEAAERGDQDVDHQHDGCEPEMAPGPLHEELPVPAGNDVHVRVP